MEVVHSDPRYLRHNAFPLDGEFRANRQKRRRFLPSVHGFYKARDRIAFTGKTAFAIPDILQ